LCPLGQAFDHRGYLGTIGGDYFRRSTDEPGCHDDRLASKRSEQVQRRECHCVRSRVGPLIRRSGGVGT
jgi:hypothetical protein